MTASVKYEVIDQVATITIDDGAKNVITHEVLGELEEAWAKAQDQARAVILCGRPGSFCAGYDINVMTGADRQAAAELGQRGGRFALQLFGSKMPTVAVCAGHAFTIGAVWLACCDVRLGEQGAHKFGMREVALNVPFSDWPLEPLKERLDRHEFIPAILHSKIYDPQAALQAGFLDQLVDPGAGMSEAAAQAAELAKLPSKAYAATKGVYRKEALLRMAQDLGV